MIRTTYVPIANHIIIKGVEIFFCPAVLIVWSWVETTVFKTQHDQATVAAFTRGFQLTSGQHGIWMNPDSTHLERWIRIWIEKYATGSELKSSCENGAYILWGDGKFSVPHSHSSPQPDLGTLDITWNCDTIITIGINSLKIYSFVALCGHCCSDTRTRIFSPYPLNTRI